MYKYLCFKMLVAAQDVETQELCKTLAEHLPDDCRFIAYETVAKWAGDTTGSLTDRSTRMADELERRVAHVLHNHNNPDLVNEINERKNWTRR